jgi:hypothetical protein
MLIIESRIEGEPREDLCEAIDRRAALVHIRRVLRSGDFSGDGVWRFALIDEDGVEEVLHFSANGDIV